MTLMSSPGIDARTAPYAALLLRVTLGIAFIAHALLKLLVLTLPGTAAFFADHGFPGWTAYLVFAAELIGGSALVLGIVPRVVALALIPVLLGAFTVHWPNGWYFAAPNGGWEYIAVLVSALLAQAALGDGRHTLVASSRLLHEIAPGARLNARSETESLYEDSAGGSD
jgi:putative oxidoreductase